MPSPHLTLRQLQIFAAVARRGSTTAAADEIALSQSATSAALNELERLLGLRLFERSGKRLLLNDNGRALLPPALALLDGAAGIEQMPRSHALQAQALRIGASTTIGNYVLPRLLHSYLHAHDPATQPAWHSKATIGNTGAICAAVAAFELDVGLVEGPAHGAALAVTRWLHDEMVVVAAPHSPLARARGRVPVERLRDAVWLVRESGSGTRESTDQLLLPHLTAYARSIELGSSEAIKHAAAEGMGVACLSHWVVRDLLDAGRLRRVRADLPALARDCHIVVHRDKQPTPALQAFLQHAVARGGSYLVPKRRSPASPRPGTM